MLDDIFIETGFGSKSELDPTIDLPSLIQRLERPKGKIDAVLDTDAFNEIDDQFAIAYMLKSPEKINVKAIYAAPFKNEKSESPQEGMEKSYNEVKKLLKLMDREDLYPIVYKGSESYLSSENVPVVSPAAEHLAELAMSYTPQVPLYVVAIGAITNVSSALLINPEIRDRIVVVWLGGNAHDWPWNVEFNLTQDIAAARVLFGCGAAVVQLPCAGVVSSFTVSGPELETFFSGKNELCTYLSENTIKEARAYAGDSAWTRVIWDVTAIAWLMDGDFLRDQIIPAPIPEYSHRYSFTKNRHFIKYVYSIRRDTLLNDLIKKLTS